MNNRALNKTIQAIASGDLSSDENFTRYIDIVTELFYYKDILKGADILCPCDTKESNFTKFFENSKDLYEINSFQCTYYNPIDKSGIPFQQSIPQFAKKYPNGIVITNPPFSCITEFLRVCENNKLKYLFIGPLTFACHEHQGSTFILNNTLWCGHNQPKAFIQSDGTEKEYGNICWYTNLEYKDCFNTLYLTHYMEHHKYSYSASHKDVLWVENCDEIPIDYDGLIRVPMSYLLKHNPGQFNMVYFSDNGELIDKTKKRVGAKFFKTPDNKKPFMAFIIQRVKGAKV